MREYLAEYSNCIIWAHLLWLRRYRKRKRVYITWRVSDSGPFPHALVLYQKPLGGLGLVSYKPKHPRKRLVPPPLFKGKVVWGDYMRQRTKL